MINANLIVCGIVFLFLLLIIGVCAFVFWCICTSSDNCKCCLGREKGECKDCPVYKRGNRPD